MLVNKNKWALLFITLVMSCVSASRILAADGQFYLLAKYAAQGATSAIGQQEYGVFLRWDLIDGQLPNDITRIELRRDDLSTALMSYSPSAVIDENNTGVLEAISYQIYGVPNQQQRLLSTVTHLKERALSASPARDFDSQLFAGELLSRLKLAQQGNQSEKLWAFMAARSDFNIARAANRAFLDKTATGERVYELLAFNANGDSRRLGRTQVNVLSSELGKVQVLPANNFSQITESACNSIDRHSDHLSVALSWQPGGANITERLANDIALSGYDLYRSNRAVATVTDELLNLDIASLARNSQHDQRGELILDGVNKVNSALITNKGSTENNGAIQWHENRQQIRAAGLNPGEQHIYYLVGRDFAGHYGPTVSLVVEVPDRQKPKSPWSFYSLIDTTNNGALLIWDAVTVGNYLAHYVANPAQSDRQVCNVDTALTDSAVEYVGASESCISDTLVREQLAVNDYRLYRFDSFAEASGFQDYDGDGIADDLEQGSARCSANPEPNVNNKIVARGEQLQLSARQGTYLDTNIEPGQSYWYRLASVSPSGQVSELTPPQKVIMIDRTPPPAPDVVVTNHCDPKKNPELCNRPVEDGDLGRGFLVNVNSAPGTCNAIYLEIDGELARVASSCGSENPENLDYIHQFGDLCGLVVSTDLDGNTSSSTRLPCTRVVSEYAPHAPQLRRFSVDGVDENSTSATVWRLPLTPISAVNTEYSHNGQVWSLQSVPVAGQEPGSLNEAYTQPITALESSADEWCVRIQSVGLRVEGELPLTSSWSTKRCQTRRTLGLENTDNLPWPAEGDLSFSGDNLLAHSGDEFADQERGDFERYFLFVDLLDLDSSTYNCDFLDSLRANTGEKFPFFAEVRCDRSGGDSVNGQVDNLLASYLPLIVYRQATTSNGTKGPWVQVSPLLETLHWRASKDPQYWLADPYFGVYRPDREAENWRFAFIDRYPHLQGYAYQYQFVSFDERNVLQTVRLSTLVTVPLAAQAPSSVQVQGE